MRILLLLLLTSCALIGNPPSSDQVTKAFLETSEWHEGKPSREEWDHHVEKNFHDRFSYFDKLALERRQDQIFSQKKVRSARFLEIINSPRLQSEFCKSIPKGAMLHVHPPGTIKKETLTPLLKKYNRKIDHKKILEIANTGRNQLSSQDIDLIQSLPENRFNELSQEDQEKILGLLILNMNQVPYSFERFQATFALTKYFIPFTEEDEFFFIKDFLKRARRLGIDYVELTHVFKYPLDIKKLRKKTKHLYKETGVIVRWNLAFIRDSRRESMIKIRDQLLSMSKSQLFPIIGIDLVANEEKSSALDAWELYKPILKKGHLKATMHAGELGHRHNVRDALLIGVDRIGHGVLVQRDALTLEVMAQLEKTVEVNLKSNLLLGVVSHIKEHPFLKYHRNGIPISLSTDDEGMFNTDMAGECELVLNNTNITYKELKKIYQNGLFYSFAEKKLKSRLLKKLEKRFIKFEKAWGLTPN